MLKNLEKKEITTVKDPFKRSITTVFILFLFSLLFWLIPYAWAIAISLSSLFSSILFILFLFRFFSLRLKESKKVNDDRKLQIYIWGFFLIIQFVILIFAYPSWWNIQ